MNLIQMLMSQLGPSQFSQISSLLGNGATEGMVKKAMGAAIPSILGGAISNASTPEGAAGLMDTLKKGNFDGSMLGNVSNLFSGGNATDSLMNSGSSLLSGLFGNKLNGIISTISSFSGLGTAGATGLLGMAAPLVMSGLGKQVKEQNLDAAGFAKFLGDQKDSVSAAMPAGLPSMDNLLGGLGDMGKNLTGAAGAAVAGAGAAATGALSGAGDLAKGALSGAGDLGKGALSGAGNLTKGATGAVAGAAGAGRAAAANATKAGSGILGKLIPVAVIALLGIGGWWFFNNQGSKIADAAGSVTKGATDLTKGAAGLAGDAVKGATDLAGDAAKGAAAVAGDAANAVKEGAEGVLDATTKAAREALSSVKFAAGSVGDEFNKFLASGAEGDKTFRFKNLHFAVGSANVDGSTEEIDNLAAVLKAYPQIKVEVDGYTDNTGNAQKNVTLSEARATTVMKRLIAKGIAANRISAKGFGADNPVASNDTKEGRAENRRIEIKVVK